MRKTIHVHFWPMPEDMQRVCEALEEAGHKVEVTRSWRRLEVRIVNPGRRRVARPCPYCVTHGRPESMVRAHHDTCGVCEQEVAPAYVEEAPVASGVDQ